MSFRHEAFFYSGEDELLRRVVSFAHTGLEADDRVVVAMTPEKVGRVRSALGARAEHVSFADMTVLARNPGRIIPGWQRLLDTLPAGTGLRAIGEPVWPGRTDAELAEIHLHEALTNLALKDVPSVSLLCPYDASALPNGVLHEARCSHPHISGVYGDGPSPVFCGLDSKRTFDEPLAPPAQRPEVMGIDRTTLADVRSLVDARAQREGLTGLERSGIVLAVHELAANTVRHGGGNGVLRMWTEGQALLCEVKDRGHIRDRMAGRREPAPGQIGGRGLWLVNQLCDLVQVRSSPDGTVVRVAMAPSGAGTGEHGS